MSIEYESLLGKPWAYDTADCFAMFRAFYKLNWNLDIPAIVHPLLWEATHPELDLIRSNIGNCGFSVVDVTPRTARAGDALLMQVGVGVRVLNHCGVYIGGGWFIHQPFRQTGQKALWAGEWRNATLVVARHPAIPLTDLRPRMELSSLLP